MKNILTSKIGIAVLAGLIGMGIGAAGAATEKQKPVSEVTPETVERIITKTETKEVEVEVEVTPESCKEAIAYARDGFSVASDFGTVMSDFLTAASQMDLDEMERQERKMGPINAKLTSIAPKFRDSSAECKAS